MSTQLLVVETLDDWVFTDLPYDVVHADEYLTRQSYFAQKGLQVINLCRNYNYLSVAYYCSLLAEARGHRVIPSVKSMLDLSRRSMYSLEAGNLDEQVQRAFRKRRTVAEGEVSEMRTTILFGRCREPELLDLARQIFETFHVPLLEARFKRDSKDGKWRIGTIRPLSLAKLNAKQRELFVESLEGYLKRRWRSPRSRSHPRFDLAILHNPQDPQPPSNARALANFAKAGKAIGIDVELIERKDYARIAEYDGLFIRDTTSINHYTYRFANKAEDEGLVVIDDPQSILRCTNKVYLAELLRANKLPAPHQVIVGKGDLDAAEAAIGYPMVIKVPDGYFSQGVFKAKSREEFEEIAARLFKESELILAQEFLYTEYDWRIGIINRTPLFASQYFMSKSHWQIVNYNGKGGTEEGGFKTVPVEQAPRKVVDTALKAANLIGDGLYGVDMKQVGDKVYIIEVNDNPNLDAGIEDVVLKDELYRRIMAEFLRRMQKRTQG